MITTGKNLGSIIGDFGNLLSEQDPKYRRRRPAAAEALGDGQSEIRLGKERARPRIIICRRAERIRVNCELNHVDVVLCCDPKAFTHTNPLEGLNKGGCLVWESSETPEDRLAAHPAQISRSSFGKQYSRFTSCPGFEIARKATDRGELQLRMQGNSFLGAFFRVSPFLKDNGITDELSTTRSKKQYEKKFGRFGEAVVASNMKVMDARLLAVRKSVWRNRCRGSFQHAQPADASRSMRRR
jgi:pyruvate-ferredoxin/flavodoxin oxidoreductase